MSRWHPVARSWCRGILEQGDCSLQKVLCNTSDIGALERGGVSSTTAMVLMVHIDAPNSSGFGMLQVVRDLILGTPWASVPQVSREN